MPRLQFVRAGVYADVSVPQSSAYSLHYAMGSSELLLGASIWVYIIRPICWQVPS